MYVRGKDKRYVSWWAHYETKNDLLEIARRETDGNLSELLDTICEWYIQAYFKGKKRT